MFPIFSLSTMIKLQNILFFSGHPNRQQLNLNFDTPDHFHHINLPHCGNWARNGDFILYCYGPYYGNGSSIYLGALSIYNFYKGGKGKKILFFKRCFHFVKVKSFVSLIFPGAIFQFLLPEVQSRRSQMDFVNSRQLQKRANGYLCCKHLS